MLCRPEARQRLAGALVAVAVVACAPENDVREFGDGTYVAGKDIPSGTWVTANTGPHSGDAQCEWTVAKPSGSGTVLLRSHDPGETIQRVYIGPDEEFKTSLCGTWVFESKKNTTRATAAG